MTIAAVLASSVRLAAHDPAPHGSLRFEQVLSGEGLPVQSIVKILADRTGFLWIGTRAGLVLYDGHQTRVFRHDATDPRSLSDDGIRTIHEDRAGRLWVGTNAGGLNLLDRATWTATRFVHDPGDPRTISHNSVYAIAEDRRGRLWVGTQKGLNLFDPETGIFERVPSTGGPDGIAHEYVMTLAVGADDRLWVGTLGGGLATRDPATGRFTHRRHDPRDAGSLQHDHVHALAFDDGGRLFVGTRAGLDAIGADGGPLDHVLTRVTVTALGVGPGVMWAALLDGSLRRIAVTSDGRFTTETERVIDEDASVIYSLFTDRQGMLWVTTFGHGLHRARTAPGAPRPLPLVSPRTGRPQAFDVEAVVEDAAGDLWVGAFGGGVLRIPAAGDGTRGYLQDTTGTERFDGVVHVARDADGSVWAGTMVGLHRIDPRSGRQLTFAHVEGDPRSLSPGYVTATLRASNGCHWVGTGGGGLNLVDDLGRVVRRFAHGRDRDEVLTDDYVTSLAEGHDGTIWVGTRGGLHALDPPTRTLRHYLAGSAPGALSHSGVNAVLIDSRGRLWVGTNGGLNLAWPGGEPGGLTFTPFTVRQGLAHDEVTSLVEDDDGSLWVATRSGLSRFDPERRIFVNYDSSDGLPSAEFNVGAAWVGRSRLFFGTRLGLVAVARGSRFPDPAPSPVVLTSIRTAAGEVAAARPAWQLDRLEVPAGEWLSLQFSVLDYEGQQRHRFAYRLTADGDAGAWVDLGGRHELTMPRLAPGRYAIELQGRNSRGAVSTAAQPLVLVVPAPFWATWPFRAALVVALAAALIGWHRARTARLRRRNAELLALQQEREAAFVRLRQVMRHLEAAKEAERRHIGRELHDVLGQDLTTAKIGVHLAGRAESVADARQRLGETATVLDGLIERVRALSLDLRPPLLDELGLAPALGAYAEAVARRTGARVTATVPANGRRAPAETEIAAYRVAQEALTNALRHAQASSVELSVDHGDDGAIEVQVRDDGVGFDVASAMRHGGRGAHLGLPGMRERVELVGGTLEIDAGPGRGTRVTARFPGAARESS